MAENNETRPETLLKEFQRNYYYYGKLMTVRDFRDEQEYMVEKNRLINRALQGNGLLSGFKINTPGEPDNYIIHEDDKGNLAIIIVQGGIALDQWGNEIVVMDNTIIKFPATDIDKALAQTTAQPPHLYLYLKGSETFIEPVQAVTHSLACEETCRPNRVKETFTPAISAQPPLLFKLGIPAFTDPVKYRQALKIRIEAEALTCPHNSEPGVFFLALEKKEKTWSVDINESQLYRFFLPHNQLLGEMLLQHMSDFDNPHHTQGGAGKEPACIEAIGWKHGETIQSDVLANRLEKKQFFICFSKEVTGLDNNSFSMALRLRLASKVEALNQFSSTYTYMVLNGKIKGEDEQQQDSKKRYVFVMDEIDVDLQSVFSYLKNDKSNEPIPLIIQVKCDFIRDCENDRVIARPAFGKDNSFKPYIDPVAKVQGGIFESIVFVKLI